MCWSQQPTPVRRACAGCGSCVPRIGTVYESRADRCVGCGSFVGVWPDRRGSLHPPVEPQSHSFPQNKTGCPFEIGPLVHHGGLRMAPRPTCSIRGRFNAHPGVVAGTTAPVALLAKSICGAWGWCVVGCHLRHTCRLCWVGGSSPCYVRLDVGASFLCSHGACWARGWGGHFWEQLGLVAQSSPRSDSPIDPRELNAPCDDARTVPHIAGRG